jgi:hypothetical protein
VKNLYVGNLPHSTTEAELRTVFEAHGVVERVNIVTDRDTGRARGFAFVEMSDGAAADKAVAALDGTQLGGRAHVPAGAAEDASAEAAVAGMIIAVIRANRESPAGKHSDIAGRNGSALNLAIDQSREECVNARTNQLYQTPKGTGSPTKTARQGRAQEPTQG